MLHRIRGVHSGGCRSEAITGSHASNIVCNANAVLHIRACAEQHRTRRCPQVCFHGEDMQARSPVKNCPSSFERFCEGFSSTPRASRHLDDPLRGQRPGCSELCSRADAGTYVQGISVGLCPIWLLTRLYTDSCMLLARCGAAQCPRMHCVPRL